jgi:hypothetical protein
VYRVWPTGPTWTIWANSGERLVEQEVQNDEYEVSFAKEASGSGLDDHRELIFMWFLPYKG